MSWGVAIAAGHARRHFRLLLVVCDLDSEAGGRERAMPRSNCYIFSSPQCTITTWRHKLIKVGNGTAAVRALVTSHFEQDLVRSAALVTCTALIFPPYRSHCHAFGAYSLQPWLATLPSRACAKWFCVYGDSARLLPSPF